MRSYGTEPQIWGGSPECDHTLIDTPGVQPSAAPQRDNIGGLSNTPPGGSRGQQSWTAGSAFAETPGLPPMTGGSGTASAQQVSNAGSQFGNAWAEEETGWNNRAEVARLLGAETERVGGTFNHRDYRRVSATCTRCGAWRGELGSEPTVEQFVEHLVEVFRAVRRVLRNDGTLWINLGDSYSAGRANLRDSLNRLLEGGSVFFGSTEAITVTAHRSEVPAHHEGAPEGILPCLLSAQRDGIEDRDEDFGQVCDSLTSPSNAGAGAPVGGEVIDAASVEQAPDILQGRLVVGPQLDTQPQTELGVLWAPTSRTSKDDKATLPIYDADKPCSAQSVSRHATWDSFAGYALRKGVVNIHSVNEAVTLRNRPDTVAGLLADFRVTQASEQQLTLTSICGRLRVTISDVRHLWCVLSTGCIAPYATLYTDASQRVNELAAKQLLGIPERVARALQRDGWVLRSAVTWCKTSAMPESVTDRPTNATEKIFLFAKSERYFWDAEAVRQPFSLASMPQRDIERGQFPSTQASVAGAQRLGNGSSGLNNAGANLRNYWVLGPEPFKDAHFAVFPSEIPRRAILAGTSERGACAACGAPHRRVSERTAPTYWSERKAADFAGRKVGHTSPTGNDLSISHGRPENSGIGYRQTETTGWAPTCSHLDADVVPCKVLDIFNGSGTSMVVARQLGRYAIGCELSESYCDMAIKRLRQAVLL